MGTSAYANQTISAIKPARKVKRKVMKLSLRHRIRNWLLKEEVEEDCAPQTIEGDRFSSNGMRMQIYRASGGYVVETRSYDRRKDENFNTMHVITDEQDLGDALGKIVMMEALQR